MGNHTSKRAVYEREIKLDILKFLNRVNQPIVNDDIKNALITQAEILLVRTSNYQTNMSDNIPYLSEQLPPSYDEHTILTTVQYREYMKRVCFYFQYFLECV